MCVTHLEPLVDHRPAVRSEMVEEDVKRVERGGCIVTLLYNIETILDPDYHADDRLNILNNSIPRKGNIIPKKTVLARLEI